MEGNTLPPPIPVIYESDMIAVFALFGVGDLVGVEGTEERKVRLSARSNVVCPLHEKLLLPDACRSCAFLAGCLTLGPTGQGEDVRTREGQP
jgi:hypothetical protein